MNSHLTNLYLEKEVMHSKIQIITRTTEEDKMSFATKTADPIELGQIPRSNKPSLVEGTL
jgi:hypothetical protein